MSATDRRVPVRTKLFYGYGSVAEGIKEAAFKTFLLFYYNQVLGLPGWMGGLAAAVALVFDAITDPIVGSLSDRTHSRFGRRHPYMYASALPMAVSFFALFNPPSGLSELQLFFWLVTFAVLVRGAMTLYSIPSNALVPELTTHYDERTALVGFRFLFGWIGGGTLTLLAYLVFMAPSEAYANGLENPAGYRAWATVGALSIFFAIVVCALGTHREIPRLRAPAADAPALGGGWQRFHREFRGALANANYRAIVIAGLFAGVAGAFVDVFGLYLFNFYFELTTQQVALFVPGAALGIGFGVALARPLSTRFDKKSVALALACGSVAIGPIPIFLRISGLGPDNHTRELLALLIGHGAVMTCMGVMTGILIGSMLADTVDQQELATGQRQEGVFAAAIAFTSKSASGVGTLLAGATLDLIGFPRGAAGAVPDATPSPQQIAALGWIVGPGLMILWFFTLRALSRYRLGRDEHRRILDALDQRRTSPGA